MKALKIFLLIGNTIILTTLTSLGQYSTNDQTIRGQVVDRASGNGVPNAVIELLNHSPRLTVQTKEDGSFSLGQVPLGRQRFRIITEGYYELIIPQLIVAGKEAFVTIPIDEEIKTPLVIVEAKKKWNKRDIRRFKNIKMEAVDEMNAVSSHKLNVEEVTKYAGNWSDPARMVTNLPGLFSVDDNQNYIVSRGNSPYGIRWEIDGVPIDNPNHFATLGNTGGLLPLLNSNMLDNSDLINGAMPANFGNAYAGVFDINLRKGNNQKFEFLGQFSLYGAEAMIEGPIKKGGASFIVSYRYGIFSLLRALGLQLGSGRTADYQDLNFKINIPTNNAGEFSVFGSVGISNGTLLGAESDSSALFINKGINRKVAMNTAFVGISNRKKIGRNTSIKTILSHYFHRGTTQTDTIINKTTTAPYHLLDQQINRARLSSTLNFKINAKTLFRTGIYGNAEWINIHNRSITPDVSNQLFDGLLFTMGGFTAIRHRFSSKFQAILGIHGRHWSFNANSWSIEPRLSLNWFVAKRHKISFGYGWHSKTKPITFLTQVQQRADGSYQSPNRDLGSTRAHHTVISYHVYLAKYWGLRINLYTQLNTNIAIHDYPSSFSLINYGASPTYPQTQNIVAEGLALNYGSEVALEKFFGRGYYGLFGFTYSRSLYQGSDQVWRNTLFDVRYIIQAAVGKEFKIGKKKRNIFYIDLKYLGRGGLPYTPIDIDASVQAGYEIRDSQNAYSNRLRSYNRIDTRFGFRFNNRKGTVSHHLYLEILNITNFKNDLQVTFDPNTNTIQRGLQFRFTPIIFYQIQF